MGAGIVGGTTTGAGATTTGAGTGIPKLIPKRTPAFTVVIPTAARARIAIVFFIMSIRWTRVVDRTSLQRNYHFVRSRKRGPKPCCLHTDVTFTVSVIRPVPPETADFIKPFVLRCIQPFILQSLDPIGMVLRMSTFSPCVGNGRGRSRHRPWLPSQVWMGENRSRACWASSTNPRYLRCRRTGSNRYSL
jgi:hypothetical protein